MPEKRERWRMTLDELAYACRATVKELDEWAKAGALGPEWTEPISHGRWRHITKPAAERAVLCSRMLRAGIPLTLAATFASAHQAGEHVPLVVEMSPNVVIAVDRTSLL